MWEALRGSEDIGPVIVCLAIAIAIMIGTGIKAWRKNEAGKRDAEIKLEMLGRGMSADDIVRVLAAKSGSADLDETTVHKK
jgi:hypothetical protein